MKWKCGPRPFLCTSSGCVYRSSAAAWNCLSIDPSCCHKTAGRLMMQRQQRCDFSRGYSHRPCCLSEVPFLWGISSLALSWSSSHVTPSEALSPAFPGAQLVTGRGQVSGLFAALFLLVRRQWTEMAVSASKGKKDVCINYFETLRCLCPGSLTPLLPLNHLFINVFISKPEIMFRQWISSSRLPDM